MLNSLSNMDIFCFFKGQPSSEQAESDGKLPDEDTAAADPETCLFNEGEIKETFLMTSVTETTQMLWLKSGMPSDAKSEF